MNYVNLDNVRSSGRYVQHVTVLGAVGIVFK